MRAQEVSKPERFQLAPCPFQCRIVGGEQVKPSNSSKHGRFAHDFSSVLNRVDDARMAAATDDNQTVCGVDDHRGILRDGVFDQAAGCLDSSGTAPIPFGILARDGPGEPHRRQELGRAGMFNELATESLVRRFQRQQAVALRTVGPWSSVKDAARDVSAG